MSQPPSQPYSGQPDPGDPYREQPGSAAGGGYPPPGRQQPAYPPPGQPSYPPAGQHGYPPPGQQSYPAPGQPSYPAPGQPSYPAPGQRSYPAPAGGPGFPPGADSHPGGFGTPMQPGSAPPRKKSSVLKIVLISVAALLVLCVGGIAITAFVAKDKVADVVEAARTTVVEPDTLGGRPKGTDPALATSMSSLQSGMSKVPGATGSVAAFYGDAAKQDLVILAAASSITGSPQDKFDQFIAGMAEGGFKTTDMKDTDPGPLGGIAKCGNSAPGGPQMAVCVWSDNGSIGMITMLFKKVPELEKEFVAMRGQVEKRS